MRNGEDISEDRRKMVPSNRKNLDAYHGLATGNTTTRQRQGKSRIEIRKPLSSSSKASKDSKPPSFRPIQKSKSHESGTSGGPSGSLSGSPPRHSRLRRTKASSAGVINMRTGSPKRPPDPRRSTRNGNANSNIRDRSGSLSSNNSSSKGSKGSKSSILTPKFLPWAFGKNVSSSIFPLDVEEVVGTLPLSLSHNPTLNDPSRSYDSKELNSNANANANNSAGNRMINNRSDPEISRYSSGDQTLRYSRHTVNRTGEHYDDDISTSSGSNDYDSHSALQSHSHHSLNVSTHELHMDTIFSEYSPMSAHQKSTVTNNRARTNSSGTPFGTRGSHGRSRSADFAALFGDKNKDLYPKGSPMETKPIFDKSQLRYGSSNNDNKGYSGQVENTITFEEEYDGKDIEFSPFLVRNESNNLTMRTNISNLDNDHDSYDEALKRLKARGAKRSIRRRVFLLLTDPQSSILSAVCFAIIAFMILCSSIVLIIQTMDNFEYNPSHCEFCDGFHNATDTSLIWKDLSMECICPPIPLHFIVHLEDYIMYFFTVEWVLRVICYDPPLEVGETEQQKNPIRLMLEYITEPLTILDLLAFLPYYLEKNDLNLGYSYSSWRDSGAIGPNNGLKTTRLFRIFRVFQLIRLGQYNSTFCALVNVLAASISSLSILVVVLIFSSAFFGSIIYWLEKGDWMYTDLVDPPGFAHVRKASDGLTYELSPFRSIPASFWWFIVTATTVGYGDVYPTSMLGKFIASLAMLLGVLVIAFPVSVFSELWSKELKAVGAFESVKESIEEEFERLRAVASAGDTAKTPPKVISARMDRRAMAVDQSDLYDNDSSDSMVFKSNGALGGNEPISMSDVQAVRHYMSTIDDAQNKIKTLLERIESKERQ